jgi:hypothetical protein
VNAATTVTLVVDCANVVGSRPDGWWRDRAGANSRLLGRLAGLPGRPAVPGPDGHELRIGAVVAVVEGRARDVPEPEGVHVIRAEADGDTAVVEAARATQAAGDRALVVTADRGLRERLGEATAVTGPAWLLSLLDTHRI